MVGMNIGNAVASDMTNAVKDYEISQMSVEGAGEQNETEYHNSDWNKQWGYFNQVPELKSAIILKATWNVGKGFTIENPEHQVLINHIKGWGKDTFEDILFNGEIIKRVGGDFYAEIIKAENGTLLNLKPLDTGSMKIVVDGKGLIKRYEQITKIKGSKNKIFKPDEIFHLCNNRLADQIHGISDITAVEKVIQADAENFDDVKKIMHRGARPMILWKLKTDDTAKIAAFVGKIDAARNLGEDMFIPDDEEIVTHEIVQVDVSGNVLAWQDTLRNKFYRTVGLPQIVPGGGGQSTESESKVIYLAFEQIVEKDQRDIERQVWEQLGLKINLIPPTSMSQQLQTDENKDASQQLKFQNSEVKV